MVDTSCANDIMNTNEKVFGQIYLITNNVTSKKYVGQTLSHRLNKGKYKPFGYKLRFNDHTSTAICNTKTKQCTYLYNSIRKYGVAAFSVELLCNCTREEIDDQEQKYISELNTLYPNGYNLTRGGKTKTVVHDVTLAKTNTPGKRGGCKSRSKETRTKIGERNKEYANREDVRLEQMAKTQKQHESAKFKRFEGVEIDTDDLDSYIHKRYCGPKNVYFVLVNVDGKQARFRGLFESYETLVERAKAFLLEVAHRNAT